MSPGRCARARWAARGRPPWWPEGEPWPPVGAPGGEVWHRVRLRFLRRALALCGALVVLIVGLSALLGRVFGVRVPPSRAGLAAAVFALVLILMVAMRAFRRLAMPVADLIQALGRVADGAYDTRVSEDGPPEVRTLARAVNAMTARLERQEAERRGLLSDISHEFRTPLSVLQGNLEGMLDGVYPPDAAHVALALEETQVLARLVDDLRTLTLTEGVELKLATAPTDVAAIARDAIASFQGQAAAAAVALQLSADPPPPPAEVDPERIRQVLNNLLSNALRYTPSGGTVRVRVGSDGAQRLAVSVEDTGSGIAAADLPHIFDRFHKSPDSRGTGLGLAIARGLVRAHGGEISAESVLGRGTTVRFTLPLAPSA